MTGTYLDEFTPITLALSRATERHGPLSPADVDALDLSVAAALLGVGEKPDMLGQAFDMARARTGGEDGERPRRWADLDGG